MRIGRRRRPPHTSILIAGDRDKRKLQSFDGGQQLQNLFSFAARRECDDNIPFGEHAEIAVQCFHGMHEQCRCTRRAESCSNLASDQAALAHSGYDHPARTCIKQFDTLVECVRHRSGDARDEVLQSLRFYADNIFADVVHGKRMLAGNS